MTSIFTWLVNTISSTTNSAAETLLSGIIRRFLEEPIQDDSLSLELFTDWTLHLTLRKSFLNVELVNSYVPFAKFKSIYFSNIQFDATYNLSNFVINLTRIVIEADVNKPEELPPVDENLTESIHVFQEQLPIEKGKSFKDWLLDCVKKANFTLDHFTIILGSDELEKISLSIESLNVLYQTDIELKMPKSSILIGEKRSQRTIADIDNLILTYQQNKAEVSIESITILVSDSIIKTIYSLVQIILKSNIFESNQNNQNPNTSNINSSILVNFSLKRLKINLSDRLSIELNGVKIQYNVNSIQFKFGSFSINVGNEKALDIQSKQNVESSFELIFPDSSSELTMFQNFPNRLSEFSQFKNKSFNSSSITVFIPSILVKISKQLISSIFEIIEWFTPFKSEKPSTTFSIRKSSYVINFGTNKIGVGFDSLQLELSKPSISLFVSQTAANTFFNGYFNLHSMNFFIGKNVSLFNFYYENSISKSILSSIFSYKQQLGKDVEIGLEFNLNDFLIRIPSKFDFIEKIKDMIDYIEYSEECSIIEEEEEINDQENDNDNDNASFEVEKSASPNMKIAFSVSLNCVSADYLALAMPARLILLIPAVEVGGFVDTFPLNITADMKMNLNGYLSNHRDILPLSIFTKQPFPFGEFFFAPIFELKPTKLALFVNDKLTKVESDLLPLNVTCCFDSIKLLVSFLMHVQYKLDNSPEKQVKTKQFDLPQKLLDMTMTLNQSLRLDNFEFHPERIQGRGFMPEDTEFIPQQFDDLQKLIESTRMNSKASNASSSSSSTTAPETEGENEGETDFQFIGEFGDEVTVSSDEPATNENVKISINRVTVSFKLFNGKDFDQIYDMRRFESIPVIGEKGGEFLSDFDFITTRDDMNSIDIEIEGNVAVSMFDKDPSVSIRIDYMIDKFVIFDNIQKSDCRIMLGIEDDDDDKNSEENNDRKTVPRNDGEIKGRVDILNSSSERMEMNFRLQLPNLIAFINQDQINFFLELSQIRMPTFPSDLIVDEPPAFQLFEICPSDIQIAAHFRLWIDIHMDDIRITVPKCQFFAVRGFDELIGNMAEYYINEMSRPGTAAVIGGLPVIKNLRRIGGAVHNLFTFDVQKYGVGVGLSKSLSALLQIIALETINMGANATSIAERFLYVTMKFLGKKDNAKEAIETGLATLVIEKPKNTKNAIRMIPTMILAPGVLTLKKLTEMMKNLRDKINPNYTKTHKYKKQKK